MRLRQPRACPGLDRAAAPRPSPVTMPSRALHRAGRGVAAAVLGAAVAATLFVAAPLASADALDDGQWWRTAMGVDELNRSGAGKGVTVALIDGPIDSSVPELKGRVASSTTECLAPGGGPRSPR